MGHRSSGINIRLLIDYMTGITGNDFKSYLDMFSQFDKTVLQKHLTMR